MALQLLRTIDPASPDADPLLTQPAGDVFGELAVNRGKLPRIIVWEVDTGGKKIAPTGTSIDVAIVMRSRVRVPGESRYQEFWSRGAISTSVLPGEEQGQGQARSVSGYTGIVTDAVGFAASSRLAIYAEVTP